ncbi:MAG: efflux RND transporter periplasmic adaptor subunit [Verrucomicrobiota bacterium]
MQQPLSLILVAGLLGLVCAGCEKKRNAEPPPGMVTQVVVVEAKRRPISETLALPGNVLANEMVEIKSETDGMVQEINFSEGQRVEKGRLLIRLDESKLAASVAEVDANFKLSQSNHERAQQLLKDKLISQQEFDQVASSFAVNQAGLELKRRQLKDARIYASFSGIVGARNVSPGQVISKNTTLTWLVDLDPIKVEISVPEKFLGQVKIGQNIEFNVTAFPNQKFKGEVYFISPQVDLGTRTALVKALIPNPELQLKPGMFASLDLTLKERDHAIVIPEVALINDGDKTSVFIVDKDLNAQLRTVKVDLRLAGQVEITSGLQGGEQIIVEGMQKVRPGGKVKLAPPEAAIPYQTTNSPSTKT